MRNHIKHIALYAFLAAGAGMGLTSCDDFLTITPSSSIVEEDFWQDKNDLDGAVFACYKRIVDNDVLTNYIYWGELRSDNVERSSTTSSTGQIAQVMNANLLPTHSMFNWASMYNAINYCNKVLVHGPEVIANDESFSESDWKPIQAEIVTLRALCHFYLARTFGEVPYITTDYNNDSQELRAPQSTQLQVLDNIIADLESIKDQAMVDYGNNVDNHGRITRKAVYALLADVYLWRASYKAGGNQPFTKVALSSNYKGTATAEELASRHEEYSSTAESDYQKCSEYCDLVIEAIKKEKIEYINKNGLNPGGGDITLGLDELLETNDQSSNSVAVKTYGAYKSLFGTGNADESIFELQVDGTSYSNSMITSCFWNISDSKAGSLTGAKALLEGVESTPNTTTASSMFTKTDYRRWESLRFTKIGQTDFELAKYINRDVSQSVGTTSIYLTDNNSSNLSVTYSEREKSNVDANWIVYRLSDIYLMKAEAMTQLSADEENLKSAFKYVREVFKRSNPYAYRPNNPTASNDSLKFDNFSTQAGMERLVLDERQREFVGEGKRWYDLVRYALRRGNTADMLNILTRKYTNSGSIQAKLADMQSLYSPINKSDIRNNNLLYQNGVWSTNETTSRTDEN